MKLKKPFLLVLLFLFLLACTCSPLSFLQGETPVPSAVEQLPAQVLDTQAPPTEMPQPQEQQETPFGSPVLSEIIFCEDVTDDGIPIRPTNSFPAGTTEVWAYFTHENMQDGMTWGRLWMANGEIWVENRGDAWEDGNSGWIAYGISEDNPSIPLSGVYSLTLYIGNDVASEASFSVAAPQAHQTNVFPAFGVIQFAQGVNDDIVPYGVATQFEEGIGEIYAVFPYIYMQDGISFRREWLFNGELTAERDMIWEWGEQGSDFAYLYDDEGLDPGIYTLNLYIDGQISRSANFEIVGTEIVQTYEGPANPEDIIDSYMMPAWENLAYSYQDVLSDLAQWALDRHVNISVDNNYEGEAAYRYSCDEPPEIGEVIVSLDYWNSHSWEEVTSTLGHELTHAVQHMTGNYRCGCSIEKEYYAWITGFYVLQEMGRMDILEDKYSGVYDDYTGKFDGNLLWDRLKEVYPECPEY